MSDSRTSAPPSDSLLRSMIHQEQKMRWIGVLIAGAILIVALGILLILYLSQGSTLNVQGKQLALENKQLALEKRHVAASCNFFGHLGGLPVTAPAPGHPASRLGVELINDSRTSFRGQGCSGRLPAPQSSLLHWAAYYHLSVTP